MSLFDIIDKRKSIRKYLPDPINRDLILKCIDAARLAPSAENVQPWRFLVIDQPDIIEKIKKSAFSGLYKFTRFAAKAPVIVIILARLDILANRIGKQIQGTQYYLIDIGIAGEHFVLQATELGLGTCWIGWFNEKKLRKELNIPGKYRIVSLISMGYYDKKYDLKERDRKKLEDIYWLNEIRS